MVVEKVIDRKQLAKSISTVLDAGSKLLEKDKFEQNDFAKLKVIKGMASYVTSAVTMVQQETAQQRLAVVIERMKQLGYETPKQLQGE